MVKDTDLSRMTFQEEDKLSDTNCSDTQLTPVWLHFPPFPTLIHIPFVGEGEQAAFIPR